MNSPEQQRPLGNTSTAGRRKRWLTVREMTVFAMLAALLFCSKLLLEWAPNIHLLGPFILAFTVVYRSKALIPVYVFVLLSGVYIGFSVWWMHYIYIWLPLWGAGMLIPRKWPDTLRALLYVLAGALHGILFGVLTAPVHALFFKMDWSQTVAWIISGLPFDITHAIGNAVACILVIPLSKLLFKLERRSGNKQI